VRCGKFLDRLDALDAGAGLSLGMIFHARRCPSCASRAAKLDAALRACRSEPGLAREADAEAEERIMAAIRLLPPPRHDFAIRDWVTAGVVIAVSTLLLPLSKNSGFLRTFFGPGYALSLAIVLGAAVTVYSAFFIGTHLDELQDFLSKRGLRTR
jgi:hypothetical protein